MMLMGVMFQATQAALPKVFDLRLREIAGAGAFGVGALVALVYLVGGLMQVAGGLLADRYPLKPLYFGSFLLQVPVLVAIAAFSGAPLIALAVVTVILTQAPLPAENMLLTRYTPERHRSLAFGVKFVLAFSTAPLALWLVSFVQGRTGEFHWLFAALAAMAAVAAISALLLPGEARRPGLANRKSPRCGNSRPRMIGFGSPATTTRRRRPDSAVSPRRNSAPAAWCSGTRRWPGSTPEPTARCPGISTPKRACGRAAGKSPGAAS